MRILYWTVIALLVTGCAATSEKDTDSDGKFLLWCVGACVSVLDRTEGESAEVGTATHDDDEEADTEKEN
jgi:hypothetical protein